MSKINKIRLVNLNYNYNTMKIDDESFYLDGENTMFNLRNGGGKSVLVQMIMAPFVNRRNRNLKDRTFESYFTSPLPTYILIEWKLEDKAGYLLTGMMVRKKESISYEDSKEKLDIINFIYEYKDKNENDINNIAIVEEKNNGKTIKSFTNSKKLFEELKKSKDIKFNYYDMNNSATTSSYFSKLKEYKIDYKEWETIIKKINLKESGLSELFTKAKSSDGLVKEWFLPAIENKLRKDGDRIKNYRELLESYIKQYKENKSSIDKMERIKLFNELSKEIFSATNDFIETIDNRENLENEISNVIVYLRETLSSTNIEKNYIEEVINDLKEQVKELHYEKQSLEIYRKQEELDKSTEIKENQELLIEESENNLNRLNRRKNILSCSKLHKDYKSLSEDLQGLENELQVLHRKNEDFTPLINDLGYTLKEILSNELIKIKEDENKKTILRKSLKEEREEKEASLKVSRSSIGKSKKEEGILETTINGFQKDEDRFNKEYEENLFRNISGFLDEEQLIKLNKNIEEENFNFDKERKNCGEVLLKNKSELKSKEREKFSNAQEINLTKYYLERKNEELKDFDKEIEKRVQVIKYIDFEEDKVFQNENIIDAFARKINSVKEDERKLRRLSDKVTTELKKLESGRVLELPKEIEGAFKKKDINIVYGMDWIKKNNFSLKENEEFIKNNPFIPYSIIMDEKEIEILEKESLDVFTATPIPIIKREDLGKELTETKQNILDFQKLKFFVSFNNKLLNEKELLELIEDKKSELNKINKQIESKENDIELYLEKKNFIENSFLTFQSYEELKKDIEILNKKSEDLRALEIKIEKNMTNIESIIETTKNEIRNLDEKLEKNKRKSKDFKNLKIEYDKYKKNKESLEKLQARIKITIDEIEKHEKRNKEIEIELNECEESIRYYQGESTKTTNELIEFQIYKSGNLIEKDKEDLVSKYRSLTKELQSSEAELKTKIKAATEKFNAVEDDLNYKVTQYKLKEIEYTTINYDRYKEIETEENIKNEQENFNKIKDILAEAKSDLKVLNNDLRRYYDKLKSEFDKNEPKSKNFIFEKNFKEEVAKIKINIQDKEKEKDELTKLNIKISNNLSNLSEYDNLKVNEEISVNIEFHNLDEIIGKMKRNLNNYKKDEVSKENILIGVMFDIASKEEFKEDSFFKDPITTLTKLTSKPKELLEQLIMLEDCYNKLIQKIAYDIELIEKEEHNILESLLEYINDIHENLGKIDNNSSITIHNKRIKMLNISVAEWEENKEIYKIRLKEYIQQLRDQCILTLEKNESIEEIIGNKINITKLYDEVASISTINIKLYKIEEDKQRQITWNEVSTNSGGEGFLSAFVILSSLLSYMRKDDSDIFNRKEEGKVLIMDNPFAQTSSAHLLKPLMDIAKKSNTQLICLTGLGGDSIYNRFDNIYVLNLVQSKLRAGTKYLRSEHVKGEEEVEVMVSSRFKIEEQTRLF
ncbi:hypothetical protein [Clostridium grantii]|uniref:Chromosome segregation ATPase n=1 Tax=Clostridium grantii DSM 8605 TaxID=1121316 RepID=A0A1M5WSD2_9CLOT|nr:hypothetical protein [Clostridium grantii]SHH90024.1 hypothetical protein SAMN02745207_03075 [Clostridium grantii DSM 8605]